MFHISATSTVFLELSIERGLTDLQKSSRRQLVAMSFA